MTLDFKRADATIYLLGDLKDDISCSEYLYSYRGIKLSHTPYFDLDKESNMQKALSDLINQGLIESAHDVSEGGIFISVLESAMCREFGFDLFTGGEIRLDSFLFGESQGRVVVTVKEGKSKTTSSSTN